MSDSIYLLDMSCGSPGDALSRQYQAGKWVAVEYSIAAGSGTMLFCPPDQSAPEIRIPMDVPPG